MITNENSIHLSLISFQLSPAFMTAGVTENKAGDRFEVISDK